MPSPAELLGRIVRFVGDILGASSLRFDVGPTLVTLGVILVLLQLVARPISRWVTADAAGLAGVGRAMALAAESGTDAVVSLGGAGITRARPRAAACRSGSSPTTPWPAWWRPPPWMPHMPPPPPRSGRDGRGW